MTGATNRAVNGANYTSSSPESPTIGHRISWWCAWALNTGSLLPHFLSDLRIQLRELIKRLRDTGAAPSPLLLSVKSDTATDTGGWQLNEIFHFFASPINLIKQCGKLANLSPCFCVPLCLLIKSIQLLRHQPSPGTDARPARLMSIVRQKSGNKTGPHKRTVWQYGMQTEQM